MIPTWVSLERLLEKDQTNTITASQTLKMCGAAVSYSDVNALKISVDIYP